jgi:hypothetical protein
MAHILDGTDRAREIGFDTYEELVLKWAKKADAPWNGIRGEVMPVQAYVNGYRWLAKCECGNIFYVTPDDTFFYCFECGNASTNGNSRPVTFPDENKRMKISRLLEQRPVLVKKKRMKPTQQQASAIPEIIRRDWNGETIQEIKAIHIELGIGIEEEEEVTP